MGDLRVVKIDGNLWSNGGRLYDPTTKKMDFFGFLLNQLGKIDVKFLDVVSPECLVFYDDNEGEFVNLIPEDLRDLFLAKVESPFPEDGVQDYEPNTLAYDIMEINDTPSDYSGLVEQLEEINKLLEPYGIRGVLV